MERSGGAEELWRFWEMLQFQEQVSACAGESTALGHCRTVKEHVQTSLTAVCAVYLVQTLTLHRMPWNWVYSCPIHNVQDTVKKKNYWPPKLTPTEAKGCQQRQSLSWHITAGIKCFKVAIMNSLWGTGDRARAMQVWEQKLRTLCPSWKLGGHGGSLVIQPLGPGEPWSEGLGSGGNPAAQLIKYKGIENS